MKSPYKEKGISASEIVGTVQGKRKKVPAFPNSSFRSQDEYFDFSSKHNIYGIEAYNLKKKMDKRLDLTPNLQPPAEKRST